MKFVVMIQSNPAVGELFSAMTDAERTAAFQIYWDVESDLEASGELIDSKAIDTNAQRNVTRLSDGRIDVGDLLPDTADHLSGYYLVEVENEARAFEIAARFPEAVVPGGIRVARTYTQEDFDALGM